ncbi:MAG: bifunctional sugar-1-phosphate nucleotidylyltransferase/acetyltransferase [Candidatus Thorarchaeota archaeon]|jgi:bifunctional UDP-N-acetylglucosamine pyrophosphorylase/glucosamine-1-phosphate N-acetyltransferase
MKKAVLLAAGDSTRMLPLSANKPKHLLPIAGKPLIFHTLESLQKAGIKETLIVYGYHGDKLREAIESRSWTMSISFVLQEERKGTGHAAGYAKEFVGKDESILMNGDVMVGPDSFEGLIAYHMKGGYEFTLSTRSIEDPSAYGLVVMKEGKATALIEKPTADEMVSNLVNAGIYAVSDVLWEAIDKTGLSPRREYEITEAISMIIEKGNVGAFVLPSWWLDIGKPWDLLDANKLLLEKEKERIEGTVENGAVLKGNVIIEQGAIVKSGAYIEGPAFIGENSVVGPNCYIRAYTSLGKKVKIGNAVEIKNCIIMDGTNVGHLSYVGDSIIGHRSNFGAGTIIANLRHDNRSVFVTVKGERFDSKRRKLGAIIGDDVKTGIGTSISPGIVIHQGARTGIGVVVDRDIEANKLVIVKQNQEILDADYK